MDAEVGHLVAVDVPGLRDVDVVLGHVLCEQASDNGGGHVAAANEAELRLLELRSHCIVSFAGVDVVRAEGQDKGIDGERD